jgi:hypothetical protein
MNRPIQFAASLLLCAPPLLTGAGRAAESAPDSNWITLLDGSAPATLDNWSRIGVDNWRIEEGAVVADKRIVNDDNFLISGKSYGNFQLRVEFWVDAAAKSGILFRGLDPYRIHPRNSYDLNICDSCREGYGTGSIINFAAVNPPVHAAGKWNLLEITADGKHITVVLDGAKTVDMIDSAFPAGLLALEYGGGTVKWRKIQIRPLKN